MSGRTWGGQPPSKPEPPVGEPHWSQPAGPEPASHPGHSHSAGPLFETVNQSINPLARQRVRLTPELLVIERAGLRTSMEQVPLRMVADVDAGQTLVQRARGLGSVRVTVQRPQGIEVMVLDDFAPYRQMVELINQHAAIARAREPMSAYGYMPGVHQPNGNEWSSQATKPKKGKSSFGRTLVLGVVVVALFAFFVKALGGESSTPAGNASAAPTATATPTQTSAPSPAVDHDAVLTKEGATVACGQAGETALKNKYPASKVKVHWIAGVVEQADLGEGTWRITLDASIDSNASRVQCLVKGTDNKPDVRSVRTG